MIIYLDDSLLKEDCGESLNKALQKLNVSHIESNHYIVCDEDLIDAQCIINNQNFSQNIIIWSKRRIEFKSLVNFVGFFIKVLVSEIPYRMVSENNIDILEVSIDYFAESSFYKLTKLILEDVSDAVVYRMISQNYIKQLSGFKITYDTVNGGGASTPRVLAAEMDKSSPRVVLCLFDSDIKYPNGPKGDTAKSIEREMVKHEQYSCISFMIESHEVENLIPPIMLSKTIDDVNFKPLSEILNKISSNLPDLYKFLDLKAGFAASNIKFSRSKDELDMYMSVSHLLDCDLEKNLCTAEYCTDKKTCKCKIINGYKNIVSEISKYGSEKLLERLAEDDIPEHLTSQWNDLGTIIAKWCISGETELIA